MDSVKKAPAKCVFRKADSASGKAKGVQVFCSYSVSYALPCKVSCVTLLELLIILPSVFYHVKQKKFPRSFLIVIHSHNFGVFTNFLKNQFCGGRFPSFSRRTKNKRLPVNQPYTEAKVVHFLSRTLRFGRMKTVSLYGTHQIYHYCKPNSRL